MKKILLSFILLLLAVNAGYCADRYSKDYLQNHKHFAIMNPVSESIAEHIIKSSLKKETGGKYKVKFEGYTTSSMRKGIFKNLEITGENIVSEGIPIPYLYLKSLTDYNYVDYTKDPVEFKSDMQFSYEMLFVEKITLKCLKRHIRQKNDKKIVGFCEKKY